MDKDYIAAARFREQGPAQPRPTALWPRSQRVIAVAALALAAAPGSSFAGRPLASDDASTADKGTCQLETWLERSGSDRAWVAAPACGVLPGLELGADYARLRPSDVVRAGAGLALKWAPEAATVQLGGGELRFGLKLGAGYEQPAGASWQRTDATVLGLASWQASPQWALHANLGRTRATERAGGGSATLYSLAAVWTPSEPLLVFAEALANSRSREFGGTVRSAGVRWWLQPDKLGLDLTASRQANTGSGVRNPTLWSIGLGWYGIGF